MARLRSSASTGFRVAVVDDDPTLLESTRRLLAYEGHDVRVAADAGAATELVRSFEPHAVLLDYHLAGETGAEVVRAVRRFDPLVQILLVTGYASEQPARRMLAELDIQGYHDKSDGPERLLVLLDAALKHAATLRRLDRQGRALRHLVEVGVEISRLQPIESVFASALAGVMGLLDCATGFIATENHGVLVMGGADEGVSLRATMGRFDPVHRYSQLPPPLRSVVDGGLGCARPSLHADGFVVIPLETNQGDRGCIVVVCSELPEDLVEPCMIYARQVVQSLENALLFERATVDPLTELFNRRFGLQQLEETLKLGRRNRDTTSVLMLDIDHFKRVNDEHGHAAGDLVLRSVAACVRKALRSTDVVVRYGGEELLAVLPSTDATGAFEAAERVRAAVEALRVPFERRMLSVTMSLGVASTSPNECDPAALLREADRCLYAAKGAGRNCVAPAPLANRLAS